jgi:hypothetical protein
MAYNGMNSYRCAAMDRQKFWTKLERKYGLERKSGEVVFPPGFREHIEGRIEGYDDYFGCLEAEVEAFLELLDAFQYLPKPIPEPIPEPSRKRTKRYLAPFQQRLHLVDFVLSRHITVVEMWTRRLSPRRRRINWREMYRAWNMEHPAREAKSSPESLKAAYYSAIKEQAVQEAYFEVLNERWEGKLREMVTEFLEANPQLAEGLARANALMRQIDERLRWAGDALQRALEPMRQIGERLQLLGMRQWTIDHEQQCEGFQRLNKVNTPEARDFRERWNAKPLDTFTESDWQAMQAEIDSLTAIHGQPLEPSEGEQ